ncbi:HAMP domain-containing protein, partial [Myxococcota bacterium]|nr:HAMP domain-containing protein [Myxococcota bacterium]
MRNLLRIKLALGFFLISVFSAVVPLVAQRFVGDGFLLWGITAGAVIAFGIIGSIILSGSLTRNIRTLSDVAGRVSRGDLSTQVELGPRSGFPDEVDNLADSINRMLQNL